MTNYDAALISVLCEAQTEPAVAAAEPTYTSYCPLRSQVKLDVASPASQGTQYAAAIALTIGATKVADNVADGDTAVRHAPWLATKIANWWGKAGAHLGHSLGFDTTHITTQTNRQDHIEAQPGHDFYYYAQPTELAVAAAFSHTAVLTHHPHNQDALHQLGRMFGRIMYLLDSYEDYAHDLAKKQFNALAASWPQATDITPHAQSLFQEAFRELKTAFQQLDLPQPALARKLLIQQLKKRSYQVLDMATCGSACSCRLPTDEATTQTAWWAFWRPGWSAPWSSQLMTHRRKKKRRCGGCCCGDCCFACDCCCDVDFCDCADGELCDVDCCGCEICELDCCGGLDCCECDC